MANFSKNVNRIMDKGSLLIDFYTKIFIFNAITNLAIKALFLKTNFTSSKHPNIAITLSLPKPPQIAIIKDETPQLFITKSVYYKIHTNSTLQDRFEFFYFITGLVNLHFFYHECLDWLRLY